MDDDSSLNEFNEIVDELIEEGLLIRDGGAHGAAKQCFTEGYESLSSKQKTAYDRHFLPYWQRKFCSVENCDDRVHQGTLCSHHQGQLDKD